MRDAMNLTGPDTLLEFADVTFRYPDGNIGLDGCSLRIARGSRNALIGANGAGKTTLFQHANGLLRPQGGTIRYAGQPIDYSRAGLRRLRGEVGLVFQNPDQQLFSASVREDVSFGPLNLGLCDDDARARTDEALALLGIAHLAARPTHQLSFGERKRVALAGAVAMRPDVLLLDEPTAGLDPAGVADLLATLAGLNAGIVLATHDVDLALAWADEVAVVVGGRVAQGPPSLLGDEAVLTSARLRRPWPLELAARLGLPGAPRDLDQLVALLPEGIRA